MNEAMLLRTSVAMLAMLVALPGCPSKDGERADAQAPPSGQPSSPPPSGPLAGLESSAPLAEAWTMEDGQPAPILYYARENVRVSAGCRAPSGQLACDAMRFLRGGMPVEIPRRALDGRTSAGIKVCQRLNQPIITVRNGVGSEDSFCRFPDGSLVSTGALEQYAMRVLQ